MVVEAVNEQLPVRYFQSDPAYGYLLSWRVQKRKLLWDHPKCQGQRLAAGAMPGLSSLHLKPLASHALVLDTSGVTILLPQNQTCVIPFTKSAENFLISLQSVKYLPAP